MATSLRERAARRPTGWLDDVLLAVVVLLLTVPVMQPLMAQQASRYTLTAALWDDRSVVLDDYAESISVDYAERNGRLLSDKAPGQPVLALPAYAVYRALGGEPGGVHRPWGNLGLWFTSVWSASVPAAALAVLMRRRGLGMGWSPFVATATALGLSTATMLLPFGTQLFSHVLSAALLYGALVALRRPPGANGPSAGSLLVAGTLAAVAVTSEYTAALAGFVLLAVAVREARLRAAWFLAGGVVPAVLLGVYHTVAFGGPFVTGYRFSGFAPLHDEGFFGVNPPRAAMLAEVLVGDRGLLLLTPLVLVGIVGCGALLVTHSERRTRDDALVAIVVLVVYALMMGGWSNATGGASPGPRYVVPAVPFLVPGVAYAFARWTPAAWTATAVGWITMGIATFTQPLAPRDEPWALSWWWERLLAGETADTVLERWVAGGTVVVPIVLAVVCGALLLGRQLPSRYTDRVPEPAGRHSPR